ncbi:O-unit flippase [Thermodesulfovibrio yellowstonii]|uniref:O-unit flippase n=2 Tax=Thermodesulfovibrio yellowstonii TaxID=28262 RepID=A0A9W6GHV2_9BACT|nr:O-unit flippase [Thermodesulfovibrio islandicus]
MVVGLFVGVWVARYLGPEKFGLLSYAQSFVGLFSAFATLGLDGIVVRELVKDEGRRDELIGTAFWLKVMGAIAVLMVLAVAIQFTSNDRYTNILVFIIASATIFQAFNVVDMYFQAKVMGKYITLANTISLFVSSIIKIAFILYKAPLIAFAWVVLFESIILALGYLYFYLKNNPTFSIQHLRFKKSTAIFLLKDSWPLVLSGIILMIQARIDQVMLQEMIGSVEVGYYSVAMRLIETFAFVPMILNSSIFPALVNAKKVSNELYRERFLNYYRLSFLLFLSVAIPIFLFSEKIVVLLYGIAYQPAGILLSLMAVRLFFANTGVARGAFMNIENLFRFSLITMTCGAIVNIVLNYYLIPIYHGKGAIFATIISFTVTVFLIDFMYNKTRENVKLQIKAMLTFYKLNFRS